MPNLADKLLVKERVRKVLGEQWLIPTIWAGSSLPPDWQRQWPIPYVLKATHGSGQNLFVLDKNEENPRVIERTVAAWLDHTHGVSFQEWLYSEIEPRIIVEPYLGTVGVPPIDFKFFVFHGRVAMIQVDTDRQLAHKRTFYDAHWNKQNIECGYRRDHGNIPRPISLPLMIEAAEALAAGFTFVRVDLYEIDGKPMFGELTFYPDSGRLKFNPPEIDIQLGKLI
jgi:hypothetical protein